MDTIAGSCPSTNLGAADQRAQVAAILQRKGKPWTCSKRKINTTREQCVTLKAVGDDPYCRDCTLPRLWAKQGDEMAKGTCECCGAKGVTIYRHGGVDRCYSCHKTKAEPLGLPAQPQDAAQGQPAPAHEPEESRLAPASWDDFTPYAPSLDRSQGCWARTEKDKINLTSEASRALGVVSGDFVEIAYDQASKAIAVRKATTLSTHTAKAYGKEGKSVSFSCKELVQKLGVADRRRIPVEVMPWGIILRAGA